MSNAISYIINSRISELKLTNTEIAEKIKCTEGTVRNIRRGDLGARSFEVVSSLCKLLSIPIELLAEVEKSNMFSQEELSFVMLYRNADPRSQRDALMLLKAHQVIDVSSEPSLMETARPMIEPSLMETARHMIEKAKEQNGMNGSLPKAK